MRRLSLALGTLIVMVLTCPAAPVAQDKAGARPAASATAPVNLNTATVAQLEALPGIGPKTAQLIVEHRQKHGRFKKVEELMNIKGIGEKSFLKLKPLVTVGPEKESTEDKR